MKVDRYFANVNVDSTSQSTKKNYCIAGLHPGQAQEAQRGVRRKSNVSTNHNGRTGLRLGRCSPLFVMNGTATQQRIQGRSEDNACRFQQQTPLR